MNRIRSWLCALACCALAACGGGGGGGEGAPADVLAGDSAAAALAALPERGPIPAAPDDSDGDVLLTRLSVVLKGDATVGQVNAAAREVGADAITWSRTGSPFVTLGVPRQADAGALAAMAARLQTQPGILFASASEQAAALDLPAEGGVTAAVDDLNHLLATRFPAAWNVRRSAEAGCGARAVTLIVPDYYFGKPAEFDNQMQDAATFDSAASEPSGTQTPQPHGYRVAATLAAKFDALLSHGANPSPPCLNIRLVNGMGLGLLEIVDKTIEAVQGVSGHVIVSSSVGYRNHAMCGPAGDEECTSANIAASADAIKTKVRDHFAQGILWARFAMQPAVAQRLLMVQAAGNDADSVIGRAYKGLSSARLGSPFAIASAVDDLAALAGDAALWRAADPALPDLRLDAAIVGALGELRDVLVSHPATDANLLLVGAGTNRPLRADLRRAALSNDGAALFAVGEDVSTIDYAAVRGTSFAAPQVAGLAAYLWLLEPALAALPAPASAAALRATAHDNGALAGIVDAYAAVLSLDQPAALTPASAPMRLAILDVDGNGIFNLADLQAFLGAYVDSGLVLEPAEQDYSRFDLNGDGFTGGSRTERMDLDPTGSTRFGAPSISEVSFEVGGEAIVFDERAVTDLQALCYYAYSSLFTDDEDARTERDTLLARHAPVCGGPPRVDGTYNGTGYDLSYTGNADCSLYNTSWATAQQVRQSGNRIVISGESLAPVFDLEPDGTLTYLGQATSETGFDFVPPGPSSETVYGTLVGPALNWGWKDSGYDTVRCRGDRFEYSLTRSPP